ncbi:hypothetical protein LTR53_015187 [Teratosphaeriaceae sp. CCFEE 6253]|nr:hypothetical protein LTR53_015187 [Teratosphaeriaceae sp. CCFEE 6253]
MCRDAFADLSRMQPRQTFMTNPYGPQTPLSAPPQGPGFKRGFQLEPAFTGRVIAPRPSNLAPGGAGAASSSEPPPKRRRGRPPKAEMQAREAAAAASRAPPATQIAPEAAVTPVSATSAPTDGPRPAPQPPTRMQISAVLTPVAPHTASSSSGSSGRRRRGRSMRNDPEASGGSGGGAALAYESPYARTTATLEDTPAQAAVMRHREEQASAQQAPRSGATGPGAESGVGPGPSST